MKKLILSFLQLFLTVVIVFAQQPIIQNPDVASLNKFIDFPVDKSTGTSKVDIPLYTISMNNFSLPITLSYHTGGIKVNEMAGVAGLGWSLHAGGTISRVVKGKLDDGGYYSQKGFLPIGIRYEMDPSYVDLDPGSSTGDRMMAVFDTHDQDLEPDVFYFSFNGYSGRFMFDKERNVHLIPEQDLDIKVLVAFSKWIISTPDGTQYHFGEVNDNYEYYDVFGASTGVSAWHLTKIITPNSEEITFSYTETSFKIRDNSLVNEKVDPNWKIRSN